MNRFWKPFRVTLSLIILIAVAFIFVDFRENLAPSWYQGVTWLQFIPSVSKFLVAAGLISAGFIVGLILTLLFGRVYCSTVCPLGILQDLISFVSRKFRKKFRFKYAAPKNFLRYSFLVLAVIPLFFGVISLTALLDPYSNFGRILSGLGQPLYIASNNLLSELLIKVKIYSMAPEELPPFNPAALLYPVMILGLVLVLALRKGRLYCNTVCPVGTLLGLLSRVSFFKVRIDQTTCTKCAKCAIACKSQCINLKDQSVDFSRCVGCFNCLHACKDNSIGYRFGHAKKDVKLTPVQPLKTITNPANQSKRQFISDSLMLTGALLGISHLAKAEEQQLNGKNLIPVKKEYPCSPPGSVSLRHFNDICTSCHLCVSACPNGVLRPSLLQYGLEGFLQPFMDPAAGYCNFDCTVCGKVCPTGAILPLTVEEKQVTQVGEVRFIKENCVVYTDETLCGACSEHCPTKAVEMVPYKDDLNIPEVNPEICVGCGACEHACPVRPHRAIYVDGLAVQQIAKKPEVKESKEGSLEEFPF
ncbi:MAG: 4Fe-4S binding protein [Mangrovibacterium sp.]